MNWDISSERQSRHSIFTELIQADTDQARAVLANISTMLLISILSKYLLTALEARFVRTSEAKSIKGNKFIYIISLIQI